MDINSRVDLIKEGFVSKNSHGKWKLLCINKDTALNTNAAEIAGQACTVLGFSGYESFEIKEVPENKVRKTPTNDIDLAPFSKHLRHTYDYERYRRHIDISGKTHHGHHGHHHHQHNNRPHGQNVQQITHNVERDHKCLGLYVICSPHAGINVTIHGGLQPSTNKTQPSIKPMKPMIHKDKVPIIQVHTNNGTTHKEIEFENHYHWSWSSSIYIDGSLKCIGILLDRHWVLADEKCVNRST